jgi:hypothetical protein
MDDTKLEEIVKDLRRRCIAEVRALQEDDPTGCCAAHHRGAINAYATAMQLLLRDTPLAEAYQVEQWSTDRMHFYVIDGAGDHPKYLISYKVRNGNVSKQVIWSTEPARAHIYKSQFEAGTASRYVHGTVRMASVDFVIAAIFDRQEIING